ncbi:diphthine methyltransferase homolog isoform X1 [Hydra vulgaris]|uniref:methylated diphthine methylhydrolase n=1 Tax=Hydra vulgaris TaxID=6087 RepID=A0ABM4D907_HYDVU
MDQIKLLYHEVLDETADCIESLTSNMFVCGTYQLVENESKRIGTIKLYELDKQQDKIDVITCNEVSTNAVLDMKWFYRENVLSVADSSGNALFYLLKNKKLTLQSSLQIDSDSLCLSTDWCKTSNPDTSVFSLSNGELALVKYFGSSNPVLLNKWKAHSLEAWIVAFDNFNSNLFYSGADDCMLKLWDSRAGFHKALITNKEFTMGVCSLQSHKFKENIFAVGSYDEHCTVWDNRYIKTPIVKTNLGGGVWRIKWHPNYDNILLTACMHNGFKIVQYTDELNSSTVIHSYNRHSSLAYGIDWLLDYCDCSKLVLKDLSAVIASCSFYDKLLTIWEMNQNKLFYEATDCNKHPILEVLKEQLNDKGEALEISSGSGQHVVYFAKNFPKWTWQPSEYDLRCLKSISEYIAESQLDNIFKPLLIDLNTCDLSSLNENKFDLILCINMVHIAPLKCSESLFAVASTLLKSNGKLITYGPYSVNGLLTPESNVLFDLSLKSQNADWGVRDISYLEDLAKNNNLVLRSTVEMPCNNKCLIFVRKLE